MEKKRDAEQRAHLERMDALDTRLAEIQRVREDERLARERAVALKQKEDDLEAYTATQSRVLPIVPASTLGSHAPIHQLPDPFLPPLDVGSSPPTDLDVRDLPENVIPINDAFVLPQSDNAPTIPSSTVTVSATAKPPVPKPFPAIVVSPSYLEWARQKDVNGASNPHVDAIMDMIGLEEVKKRLLQTIAKIDASKRQNASLTKERFNIVFLGNPGTGTLIQPPNCPDFSITDLLILSAKARQLSPGITQIFWHLWASLRDPTLSRPQDLALRTKASMVPKKLSTAL